MSAAKRVLLVPDAWPTLHLEKAVPTWSELVVDGLVRRPLTLRRESVAALDAETHDLPVHCVWGWSRTGRWTGVPLGPVLEQAGAMGSWATVRAASGVYSSCLPLADAARGLLVWARDGQDLTPEQGGPLRYLAPPEYWGYKGVKWVSRITVGDRFVPGFWESKVADPMGRIPDEVELPCPS
jgi:DMSO/TMAO reductase YedYZ molybdopterin-dependent catalytic subunit